MPTAVAPPSVTKTAPTALPGAKPAPGKAATAFKAGGAGGSKLALPAGIGKWLIIGGVLVGGILIIRRLRRR